MQISAYSDFLKAAGQASVLEAEYASDPLLVAGAMQAVLDHAATELKPDAEVTLTSLTLDTLGQSDACQTMEFETRLDRQTRTLIFISGLAKQGEAAVLKATAIYRIS